MSEYGEYEKLKIELDLDTEEIQKIIKTDQDSDESEFVLKRTRKRN